EAGGPEGRGAPARTRRTAWPDPPAALPSSPRPPASAGVNQAGVTASTVLFQQHRWGGHPQRSEDRSGARLKRASTVRPSACASPSARIVEGTKTPFSTVLMVLRLTPTFSANSA